MKGKILIFNTGSATLKYKLFDVDGEQLKIDKVGLVENIGSETGPKNHIVALSLLFRDFGLGVPTLANIDDLLAIGHRVVYGANEYQNVIKLDIQMINNLKKYNSIAPLHNPPILDVIKDILNHTGQKGHRNIPNYAVFDSSFFKSLPEESLIYPLPYRFYKEYGIQRFGFHGISHCYVISEARKKFPDAKKIISIHLGAGCSITASVDGKPVDTSMGFTPREGLMMTTRSGDIDPGILIYLLENKIVKNVKELDLILNQRSGLFGISEMSSDLRDLLYVSGYKVIDPHYRPSRNLDSLPDHYKKQAKLAIEMYCYRIKKYIGAYYAILGGCDVLVFTGRIGELSAVIRNKIISGLDHILNKSEIEVIVSDEEKQIAQEIIQYIKD